MKALSLRNALARAMLFLGFALAAPVHAAPPSLVPPTETYAGKTHAQWLESWFTWIFGIPGTAAEFPFMDTTGASSGANQSGPVFFLSKSWVGKKGNPPEQRTASVPEGTALFIPFSGIFSASPGRDPATLAAENREMMKTWAPFVFRLVVDGQELAIDSSFTSPLLHETSVFSLPLPANAAARSPEVGFGDLPEAVYPFHSLEWLALLKPLPVGQHTLHVQGSAWVGTPDERVTDIAWTIQVIRRPVRRSVLATSAAEFSGFRDSGGWSYGFRTIPPTGTTQNYDPEKDFIPFSGGPAQGDWDGQVQQWTGPGWKTKDGTEMTVDSARLAVPDRWPIRRWQASELPEKGPAALKWTLAKADASCGNGVTGALHINGQLVDKATIAFDRTNPLTRTYHALLTPGDYVDLVLQPGGTDGTDDLACDHALMTLSVSSAIPNFPRQPDNKIWLSGLPTPKLAILSQSMANGRTALNWRSQASATYGIKASNDFANWTDVASGLPGAPTRTRWSEPLMSPGQPARFYRIVEETKSIEGLWVAVYGDHGHELIRIRLEGDQAVATKLIGDPNVPSGQVTWKADVRSGLGQAQGADTGFVNPRWYPGKLTIAHRDQLSFTWTGLGTHVFRRVD